MKIKLRTGEKTDLPRLRELIVELAIYEKEPHAVVNTLEMMERDAFGKNPVFGFILAEANNQVIGASIYYYRYSTWKGRTMYLEDLIVTASHRGNGAGKLLFDETVKIAKTQNCTGMMWQVLDWNESAINFYKKYDVHINEEWLNCNLYF